VWHTPPPAAERLVTAADRCAIAAFAGSEQRELFDRRSAPFLDRRHDGPPLTIAPLLADGRVLMLAASSTGIGVFTEVSPAPSSTPDGLAPARRW
jgi:hypothetical protein